MTRLSVESGRVRSRLAVSLYKTQMAYHCPDGADSVGRGSVASLSAATRGCADSSRSAVQFRHRQAIFPVLQLWKQLVHLRGGRNRTRRSLECADNQLSATAVPWSRTVSWIVAPPTACKRRLRLMCNAKHVGCNHAVTPLSQDILLAECTLYTLNRIRAVCSNSNVGKYWTQITLCWYEY